MSSSKSPIQPLETSDAGWSDGRQRDKTGIWAGGGGRALSFASGVPSRIYGVNSSRAASLGFRTNSHKMLFITAPAFLPNADEPYMDQNGDLRPPECSANHRPHEPRECIRALARGSGLKTHTDYSFKLSDSTDQQVLKPW